MDTHGADSTPSRAPGPRDPRRISGAFRFHAVFQPNLSNPSNTPILDPLALDDITIVYRDAVQPTLSCFIEGISA